MTNKFFVALLLAVLIHCPVNAEPRLTKVHENLLQNAFINYSDLSDPFSVQFRKIQLYNQTESTSSDGSSFQICGELNSKNMYGGYTGWNKFVVTITTKDKGTNLDHANIVTEVMYGFDELTNLWLDSPCITESENKEMEELEAEVRRLFELFTTEESSGPETFSADEGDSSANIRFRAYYDRIWSQIRATWVIPEGVTAREDLLTVVGIRIAANGVIEDHWIEKGSGNIYYDQSTLRAIREASPLPPLPEDFNNSALEVGINFRISE